MNFKNSNIGILLILINSNKSFETRYELNENFNISKVKLGLGSFEVEKGLTISNILSDEEVSVETKDFIIKNINVFSESYEELEKLIKEYDENIFYK